MYTHKKRIETSKENSLEYVMKARLNDAKLRSRKHNVYFDLTYLDMLNMWSRQNGLCALSGIPMTHLIYSGKVSTNLSIDRIDPNKGYTKENTLLVCSCVNMMKGMLTIEELIQFCQAILNTQKTLIQ